MSFQEKEFLRNNIRDRELHIMEMKRVIMFMQRQNTQDQKLLQRIEEGEQEERENYWSKSPSFVG